MGIGLLGTVFLVIVLVGFSIMFLNIYNGLISLKNQVAREWSNIDVILKQRNEEIPQLVKVIEQYTGYEASILKKITEARSSYGSAQSVGEKIKASQQMSLALQGVAAIGEAYPDLKSNANFIQLQNRISNLETMISERRESYNEAVTNFNTRIEQVPDAVCARLLNYQRKALFEATAQERTLPSLEMNLPQVGRMG